MPDLPDPRAMKVRDKINAVGGTVPQHMGELRARISELAENVYDLPEHDARREIRYVIREVYERAGTSGDVPDDFPQAKDARRHLWVLTDAENVWGG